MNAINPKTKIAIVQPTALQPRALASFATQMASARLTIIATISTQPKKYVISMQPVSAGLNSDAVAANTLATEINENTSPVKIAFFISVCMI